MPTNPPGQLSKTFSVNIYAADVKALGRIASSLGLTRNKLVREVLAAFVREPKEVLLRMQKEQGRLMKVALTELDEEAAKESKD
jgi:hypothetical protein